MTNIVDESKDKLHDVFRCGLTVIQFHTPDRKEKKNKYLVFFTKGTGPTQWK